MGGKGIIDIMIAASKNEMDKTSREAQKAGYLFRQLASEAGENTEKYQKIKEDTVKEIITKALSV